MAYMVFIYIKAAAGRHSPPTAITNTALSASDCGRCALVVLTACHLGAMYAHLQQKRSSQCSHSTSHIDIALPLPLCRSIEIYVLLRVHAMAMTDSTPKVFSWADLQGKQGGFMQRDERTQVDHQLQCCRHANDFRQGYNTYWLECALSAGIAPRYWMHEWWYQYLRVHRLRRKRSD